MGIGRAACGAGHTMQARTVQMLQTLPDDFRERGWTLVVADSGVIHSADGSRYRAIYSRPFDPALDAESLQWVAYDKVTRQQIVRISTLKGQSGSWRAARRDAIRRMREADAKRRRTRRCALPTMEIVC